MGWQWEPWGAVGAVGWQWELWGAVGWQWVPWGGSGVAVGAVGWQWVPWGGSGICGVQWGGSGCYRLAVGSVGRSGVAAHLGLQAGSCGGCQHWVQPVGIGGGLGVQGEAEPHSDG